ncbi:MAG: hypothetical protein K2J32_06650 [Ruminococcus sp.]|nr:hypothetical protein [Ruminococcus sp.]
MNNNEQFRWIRNDIDISSIYNRLPASLKEVIAEAEEADRNGRIGALYEI